MECTISSFYKFIKIPDCDTLKDCLLGWGEEFKLRGTILIAPEGINGMIAGDNKSIKKVLEILKSDIRFSDLQSKESLHKKIPFQRWKVKIKKEILTFEAPEADPTSQVGLYVKPKHWNALIKQPDILLIDTRNSYEVAIGTFHNAIDPQLKQFSDFKKYVRSKLKNAQNTKIAMYCTGGIRCEKASAYLLSIGFKEVYHLEGGILKYLEEVNPNESLWDGACFVFDERVSVLHGLQPGGHKLCECGFPVLQQEITCTTCKNQKVHQKKSAVLLS